MNLCLKSTLDGMQSTAGSGIRWQVQGSDGGWRDYPIQFADMLEQGRETGKIRVRYDGVFDVDLLEMVQLDFDGYIKKVRRIQSDLKYANHSSILLSDLHSKREMSVGLDANSLISMNSTSHQPNRLDAYSIFVNYSFYYMFQIIFVGYYI